MYSYFKLEANYKINSDVLLLAILERLTSRARKVLNKSTDYNGIESTEYRDLIYQKTFLKKAFSVAKKLSQQETIVEIMARLATIDAEIYQKFYKI